MLIRLVDIIIAVLVLVLFSPLFVLVAIAIKLESKGPVIFRQERVTLGGKLFRIHKFRSMAIGKSGTSLTDTENAKRITKVGKFVRKSHIDELLQFVDVLCGNMTIVGPRPEVPEYTKYHKEKWKKVLKVKPGITGYATLKCMDYEYEILAASKDPQQDYIKKVLPKKLDLEIEYIKKKSVILDVKIIYWTVCKVLGISK